MVGDYRTFYRPDLNDIDFSLVVKSGPDGYACYSKGNTYLFGPINATAGYTNRKFSSSFAAWKTLTMWLTTAFYAHVLVRDAWRLSPALLLSLQHSNSTIASTVHVNDAGRHPAIIDLSLNLTIIFDPETYLPSNWH